MNVKFKAKLSGHDALRVTEQPVCQRQRGTVLTSLGAAPVHLLIPDCRLSCLLLLMSKLTVRCFSSSSDSFSPLNFYELEIGICLYAEDMGVYSDYRCSCNFLWEHFLGCKTIAASMQF